MVAEQLRAHILICIQEAESTLGMAGVLETSKPALSDTPPPTRPHLLSLPKQFYRLGTKYSNVGAYGGILIRTITGGGCI